KEQTSNVKEIKTTIPDDDSTDDDLEPPTQTYEIDTTNRKSQQIEKSVSQNQSTPNIQLEPVIDEDIIQQNSPEIMNEDEINEESKQTQMVSQNFVGPSKTSKTPKKEKIIK